MANEITRLSCDVLIAGGGIGGLCCAAALKEANPDINIIIVEKQTAGYGGKANKGGGVLQYFNDEVDPMAFLGMHVNSIGCYLGDQDILLKYMKMNHAMLDRLTSWGVNVPKNEDGSYNVMPTGPFTSMVCVDLDLCLKVRRYAEKFGVKIYDKTTMAELFAEDGKIKGAACYNIIDGTKYVISAPVVILATGSQNYRMASMWSNGRGDGIAAAYKVGAEMRNAEFGNFAQLFKVKSHNEVVFGENWMYNAKGEFITPHFLAHRETDINSSAINEWYQQMQAGTGPVHLEIEGEGGEEGMEKKWKRPYGQKFRELNTISANAVDTDLEVCPMFIGEQSPINVNADGLTSVAGLYAIGDCSYCGSASPGAVPAPPGRNRGSGILNAVFTAICTAEAVAQVKIEAPAEICGKCADKVFDEVFAPLGKEEGVNCKEVIDLVQRAMAPMEYSVVMHADRMAEAMKLVEQAEKLSENMKAVDLHDLLSCNEAKAMVLSAKMHYTASALRKESRGWFRREDYPAMDNENWLKWIILKNENGKMVSETRDVPIEKWPIQPPKPVIAPKGEDGFVFVSDEEKKSPLYTKYFQREMVAPAQSRYDEVAQPFDSAKAHTPQEMNKLFDEGYLDMECGYCNLPDGSAMLANLTQMPGVTPEMFDWWFAWHGVKPLRYKIWNREQHYSAQTRDLDKALNSSLSMKERYWDTTHDVTEDCNMGPENIIINFRNPADIGFDPEKLAKFDGTIVCAGNEHSGCIMVHFIRPVPGGCELRSRFWMGYGVVDGKPTKLLPPGITIPLEPVKALLDHNIKEFTHLASILPEIYAEFGDEAHFNMD